jgi:hypothetical protein
MSAFNWIEFDGVCPLCNKQRRIRAQTHLASSYDGDERGRFCDVTYHLGEEMHWWNDFPRRDTWYECEPVHVMGNGDIREACYAKCIALDHELFAILEFNNFTPRKVIEIGPEAEWPAGYLK